MTYAIFNSFLIKFPISYPLKITRKLLGFLVFQEVYNGTISQKCVNVAGFGHIIFQHAIVPWRALGQVVFGKLSFILRPTSK